MESLSDKVADLVTMDEDQVTRDDNTQGVYHSPLSILSFPKFKNHPHPVLPGDDPNKAFNEYVTTKNAFIRFQKKANSKHMHLILRDGAGSKEKEQFAEANSEKAVRFNTDPSCPSFRTSPGRSVLLFDTTHRGRCWGKEETFFQYRCLNSAKGLKNGRL